METYLKVYVKIDDLNNIAIRESCKEYYVTFEKNTDYQCEMYIPLSKVWGTSSSEGLWVKFHNKYEE